MRKTLLLAPSLVLACATPGCALLAPDREPPRRFRAGDLPSHQAVQQVLLRIRGREVPFMAYVAADPAAGEVRAHVALESGPTGAEVAVRGADWRVLGTGAFEGVPRFEEELAECLARTWGGLSVFGPEGAWISLPSEQWARTRSPDGGSVALLLARPDGTAAAAVSYADFDADGVPRAVEYEDLREGYTVTVEVVEVRLVEDAVKSEVFHR